MIRFLSFGLLAFLIALPVSGQKKITVEELFSGAFRAKNMEQLSAMKNSNQYTVLTSVAKGQSIDLYDFKSLAKVSSVFETTDFAEISRIDDYVFDKSEQLLLIGTNEKSIYRHSFTADYYLFNTKTRQLSKIIEAGQEPLFSPDGSKIGYAKDNNLYLYELASGQTKQLTQDGTRNKIINGITDWVYEEEFAFVRAFDWSADSKYVSYIKFDESQVPEFSMSLFKKSLYPETQTFKYPKAGEKNSVVSLHIIDVNSNSDRKIDIPKGDVYLPRMKWTSDANLLSVQVLNRHQNKLDLIFVDAKNGTSNVVLTETDKAYVSITDDLTFLPDNSFIWSSERDGYNHLYHYSKSGKLKKQLTSGKWEVTNYYGLDAKSDRIFYQSTENGSINRDVYQVSLNGKNKKRLSMKSGTNSATFSPFYDYFINSHSSATEPASHVLHEIKSGKEIKKIVENSALAEKMKAYDLPAKEFLEIQNAEGTAMNAWMMKPKNFDATKKYPVIFYQYSGPGSQEVSNSWWDTNEYWMAMLTQNGYIAVCVDPRGTGYKGSNFKKVTQNQLGKYETLDQIAAAKAVAKFDYVDPARIGIFGWSYGGFMAANCLFQGNDVFKTGIAVAPVTNWRFYDSVYTERYLQTPQENPTGYDENSPINHVGKLKGKFLLIHGSADDNVHVQNSMEMIEALIQANKQFEWAIYPDKDHSIYGGKTRIQLFTKMSEFIYNNL